MNRFITLLKREYWEHRGGFFWAPVITGAIFLVFTFLFGLSATLLVKKKGNFDFDGVTITPGKVLSKVDAEHLGYALDGMLFGGIFIVGIVCLFAMFFYCLGALYDDRRDRSILFWKSLPISDRETVLSKVTTALVGTPVVALGIGFLVGLGMLLVALILAAANGVNLFGVGLMHTHPFQIIAKAIALFPVYIMWALPSVGWLLFCSAWAKSKPFLWAVLTPVLSGVLVSWFDVMPGVEIDSDTYWHNVVFRLLFSIIPGTWGSFYDLDIPVVKGHDGPQMLFQSVFSMSEHYAAFGTWQMWAGIIAGVALIFGAIHFRKNRELAD